MLLKYPLKTDWNMNLAVLNVGKIEYSEVKKNKIGIFMEEGRNSETTGRGK